MKTIFATLVLAIAALAVQAQEAPLATDSARKAPAATPVAIAVPNLNPTPALTEKQIKKEWKKRLRKTDPLEFKAMSEERDMLKAETTRMTNEMVANSKLNDSLKTEVESLRNTVSVQKESYNELMTKYEAATKDLEASSLSFDVSDKKGGKGPGGAKRLNRGEALTNSKGVVFSVQVGVIERESAEPKFAKSAMFVRETSDGKKRVMMGAFRSFAPADALKDQMKELGIRDAWVVAYKDGKRTSITAVLAEKANPKPVADAAPALSLQQ